jgi:hypothetical protein
MTQVAAAESAVLCAVAQRVQCQLQRLIILPNAMPALWFCLAAFCVQRSKVLRDVEGLQSAMELTESARRQYNESGIAALAAVPSLAGSPYVVEEPAKQVGLMGNSNGCCK